VIVRNRENNGRIEVNGRRGRRRNYLLDGFVEMRGCWKLKKEAIYRLCRELALEEAIDLSLNQTAG
jgi:hypothetical protein